MLKSEDETRKIIQLVQKFLIASALGVVDVI